jgi:hypothetical protein
MTSTKLEQDIDGLAELPRADLLERWRALYRADPPKGISRPLLIRAVAYGMQAKRSRGLTPAMRRHLRKVANGDTAAEEASVKPSMKIAPGGRLIREWNGVSHVVEVLQDGFVWNGERHASLSAVARAITGARWSGPRFFGLTAEETS